MLELLAGGVPLMLAAAANPAVVALIVLTLTAPQRPLARAIAFVAGFALVLVAAGIAGLALFGSSRDTFGPGGALFGWLDIGIGIGLLAGAGFTWAHRSAADGSERLVGRLGPAEFFALGALMMITDASAIAAYTPLLREIAIADVGNAERAIVLAISVLVILAPIATPVLIRVLAPQSSERVLGAIRRFLDRYGALIAAAVFAAIGAFLLIRGIGRI